MPELTLRDQFAILQGKVVRLDEEEVAELAEALVGPAPDYRKQPEEYLQWVARYVARVRFAIADAMVAEKRRLEQMEQGSEANTKGTDDANHGT